MGLFSFLKNAGAKLFGQDEKPVNHAEPAMVEQALIKAINNMGYGVDNLGITFADGTATVTGHAHTQADKEKIILTVGNMEGVSQVDDQMSVEAAAEVEAVAEADFYTVESGDSLSKIAKAMYGDANKYNYIFEENKPMLSHPDKIFPGQVLRIPRI